MSEILKCPFCGESPKRMFFGPGWSCGYTCCGYSATILEKWNKFAAAMALTLDIVWADECEEQKEYLDDTTSNRYAWRSIVNLSLEADENACKTHEKALEVFNE